MSENGLPVLKRPLQNNNTVPVAKTISTDSIIDLVLSQLGFKNLIVKNFSCMETSTYNDIYHRPFSINNSVEFIQDKVNQFQNNLVTTSNPVQSSMSAGLHDIVLTEPINSTFSHIPNGWNARRVKFILEIEVTEARLEQPIYLNYVGYSEYLDLSIISNKQDPKARFVINDIYITIPKKDQFGNITRYRQLIETLTVTKESITNINNTHNTFENMRYVQTPRELIKGCITNDLVSTMNDEIESNDIENIIPAQNIITKRPVYYQKKLVSPIEYSGSLIKNFTDSVNLSEPGSRVGDILHTTIGSLDLSYELKNDVFLRILGRLKGNGLVDNEFTLEELENIFPTTKNMVLYTRSHKAKKISTFNEANFKGFHDAGDTEYWNNDNLETLVANNIANAVTGLMSKELLNKLSFSVTRQPNNELFITMIHLESMLGLEPEAIALNVRSYIDQILYPLVSNKGQLPLHFMVNASIINEIWIDVTIDGVCTNTIYALPMFCDNVFSPVISPNLNIYTNNVNNLYTIVEQMLHNNY